MNGKMLTMKWQESVEKKSGLKIREIRREKKTLWQMALLEGKNAKNIKDEAERPVAVEISHARALVKAERRAAGRVAAINPKLNA